MVSRPLDVGKSCVVLLLIDVEEEDVEAEVDVSVLFRFQQSGNIFFCSSAIVLARWEYCSLSSRAKPFQASPRRTLIALKFVIRYIRLTDWLFGFLNT